MCAGLFDGVADGLIISDCNGNLVDWNPAALRLHGFKSLEEVQHHLDHFEEFFELTARGATSPLPLNDWPIARAMRHEPVRNVECDVRRLDTQQSWIISYDAVWIQSELDGRPCELIVLTLRDMTAHRRAEEAKDQAQRQLVQLDRRACRNWYGRAVAMGPATISVRNGSNTPGSRRSITWSSGGSIAFILKIVTQRFARGNQSSPVVATWMWNFESVVPMVNTGGSKHGRSRFAIPVARLHAGLARTLTFTTNVSRLNTRRSWPRSSSTPTTRSSQ